MVSGSSSYSSKPNNKNNSPMNASSFETDPQENTICVNTDQSNFRVVVQKLTGANTDPTVQNLLITIFPHPLSGNHRYGPRPSFNLQERIKSTRNLRLQLNPNGLTLEESFFAPRKRMMDASPVSTMDTFLARGFTPRKPVSPFVQEKLAIATSRMAEPELLPLFPTSPGS